MARSASPTIMTPVSTCAVRWCWPRATARRWRTQCASRAPAETAAAGAARVLTQNRQPMLHLLNLLAAIALLVWGTNIVRTGVLRVFGAKLRELIAISVSRRVYALLSGMGVTALVQSSTATCLIVASFAGQGLISNAAAFTVMLGADLGTALMTIVFSFDLSWVSPLLIFGGVVLSGWGEKTAVGRVGRIAIGLGLITLALGLINQAIAPLTESAAVRGLLVALPNDVLLEILVGALLTVLSYSSLAVVLLTAPLAE